MTVNPNETTHTISLISRFDVNRYEDGLIAYVNRVESDNGTVESLDCLGMSTVIVVNITNSFKGESTNVENTFNVINDKMSVTFDYQFSSESSYSIHISDADTNETIYRGLILATTQTTQDYSLTQSEYNWK